MLGDIEIYRCEGSSIGDTVAAGMTNNFAKYKLIKTTRGKGFQLYRQEASERYGLLLSCEIYKTVGNKSYYIDEVYMQILASR